MFSRKSNTVKRDARAADHNMVLFPQKEIVLRGLIGFIEELFSLCNFNYRLLRRGFQKKKGRSAVTTHCHPTGVPSWLPIVHFFHRLISLFALFFSPFSPPALLPNLAALWRNKIFILIALQSWTFSGLLLGFSPSCNCMHPSFPYASCKLWKFVSRAAIV